MNLYAPLAWSLNAALGSCSGLWKKLPTNGIPKSSRFVETESHWKALEMGLLTNLFAGSASTLVEQVSKVIDEFHLSTEEKQQLSIRMQEIVLKREQMLQDSVQAEMSSKERMLVAELTQGDSYTKRARPTVVYAGLVFILLNYTVLPGIALIGGAPRDKCTDSVEKDKVARTCTTNYLTLPEEFWWAWAGIVGTWSIGRTAEKLGARNTLTSRITGNPLPGSDNGAVG